MDSKFTFNRTIVELKFAALEQVRTEQLTFNRTIVELKWYRTCR